MTTTSPLPTTYGWVGAHRDTLTDRRFCARAWVDLAMDVSVDDFWHACQVVDVSETGMMFVLSKALASRDSRLIARYDMHVSATQDLELLARPVWRRGAVQAARFVALGDAARRALIDIVHVDRRSGAHDVARLDLAEAIDARAHRRVFA